MQGVALITLPALWFDLTIHERTDQGDSHPSSKWKKHQVVLYLALPLDGL